jgi:hypothetical protein
MAKTWRCLPTKTCLRRVDDVSLRAGPGEGRYGSDVMVSIWFNRARHHRWMRVWHRQKRVDILRKDMNDTMNRPSDGRIVTIRPWFRTTS